ncbi:MAG: iron dicitrate transport regulator FecR [Nostocales cyanobacterium]|nr:MAG: iron dicitrate transport regulator FecR [Nostocales cyanobacterium]TAF13992.1 MAG: iron dicitrate transport regulator FecR [Nostocales cyanobacterium]
MKNWWAYQFIFVLTALLSTMNASSADTFRVKVNRWLEVRRSVGQVFYVKGQTSQPVKSGLRLTSVGDTIVTKEGASAVLALDIGTGFVNIAENTIVSVNKLEKEGKGGRVTQLLVKTGQVRLQLRRLTHDTSRVEISTPAGVAGVRGTIFGVSVQDNGKTGIGTKEGSVATSAQGKTVLVKAGFQNLTIPGEPPTPPVPLRDNPGLNIIQLVANGNQVRVVGTVDPVNLVKVFQQPINIEPTGKFDITVPLPPNLQVEAEVITPLGTQQPYQLAVP